MSKIRCQQCHKRFPIPEGFDGTEILCPYCGAENVVTSADAGEIAFVDPKQKRKKRLKIAAIITSCAVTIGAVAAGVAMWVNDLNDPYRGFEFTLSQDGSYYVLTKARDEAYVTIPKEYNGKPVKEIGIKAFFECRNVVEVVIPNSVTQIDERAFVLCTLQRVELPDSLISIGDQAFYQCSLLESVQMPDSVTDVGRRAFEECYSLTTMKLSNCLTNIEENIFYSCTNLESIEMPNSVTSIANFTFFNCRSLTSIEIPDSVTEIGSSAFMGCDNLIDVIMGEGVERIGEDAFSNCSSLTNIELPDGVTVDDSAFDGCSSLTRIVLPNSVGSIGHDAFNRCSSLTEVYYGGTESEWEIASVGNMKEVITNATVYYYSKSEPTESGNYWHYVDGGVTTW